MVSVQQFFSEVCKTLPQTTQVVQPRTYCSRLSDMGSGRTEGPSQTKASAKEKFLSVNKPVCGI